jgi:hypothetical protein
VEKSCASREQILLESSQPVDSRSASRGRSN